MFRSPIRHAVAALGLALLVGGLLVAAPPRVPVRAAAAPATPQAVGRAEVLRLFGGKAVAMARFVANTTPAERARVYDMVGRWKQAGLIPRDPTGGGLGKLLAAAGRYPPPRRPDQPNHFRRAAFDELAATNRLVRSRPGLFPPGAQMSFQRHTPAAPGAAGVLSRVFGAGRSAVRYPDVTVSVGGRVTYRGEYKSYTRGKSLRGFGRQAAHDLLANPGGGGWGGVGVFVRAGGSVDVEHVWGKFAGVVRALADAPDGRPHLEAVLASAEAQSRLAAWRARTQDGTTQSHRDQVLSAAVRNGRVPDPDGEDDELLADALGLLYQNFRDGMVDEFPGFDDELGEPGGNEGTIGEANAAAEGRVPFGAGREERYDAQTDGMSDYGGVVFGATADAPGLIPVAAFFHVSGNAGWVELVARTPAGETVRGRLGGYTPTELWSARHVLRPTAEMMTRFRTPNDGCGLVTCRPDGAGIGVFGVHPAVADTPLARSLLLLDVTPVGEFPALATLRGKYFGLQWYDAKATISVKDGGVRVAAADGLPGLVRLRAWGADGTPKWLAGAPDRDARLGAELEARVFADLLPTGSARPLTRRAVDEATERVTAGLARELAADLPIAHARAVPELYDRLPYLPAADRFARLLAVLNWVADHTGDVPVLPPGVEPVRIPVPTRMSGSEAFAVLPEADDALPAAAQDGPVPPTREEWEVLRTDGRRVGFRRLTETTPGTGRAARETRAWTRQDALRGGARITTDVVTDRADAADGSVLRFELRMGDLHVRGEATRPGRMRYTIGDESDEEYVTAIGTATDGWQRLPAGLALEPGRTFSAGKCLDPILGVGEERWTVVGPEQVDLGSGPRHGVRVARTVGAKSADLWYAPDRGLIGWRLGTLTGERVPGVEAVLPPDEAVNLLFVPDPLPPAWDVSELVVRLHFARPGEAARVPSGGRQTARVLDPETCELTLRPAAIGFGTEALGPTGPFPTAAERTFGGDDPAVRRRADQAFAPGRTDPVRDGFLAERFLSRAMRADYGRASGDAGEVAADLTGACSEAATLCAALCRTRGVPARVVHGLAYDPDARAFVGHAWVETWAGGRWTPRDPTTGRGGVPATHVQLGVLAADPTAPAAVDAAPSPIRVEVVRATRAAPDPEPARPAPYPTAVAKVERVDVPADRRAKVRGDAAQLGWATAVLALTRPIDPTATPPAGSAPAELAAALGVPAFTPDGPLQHAADVDRLTARCWLAGYAGPRTRAALADRYGPDAAAAYTFARRAVEVRDDRTRGRRTAADRAAQDAELSALARAAGWAEADWRPVVAALLDDADVGRIEDAVERLMR